MTQAALVCKALHRKDNIIKGMNIASRSVFVLCVTKVVNGRQRLIAALQSLKRLIMSPICQQLSACSNVDNKLGQLLTSI